MSRRLSEVIAATIRCEGIWIPAAADNRTGAHRSQRWSRPECNLPTVRDLIAATSRIRLTTRNARDRTTENQLGVDVIETAIDLVTGVSRTVSATHCTPSRHGRGLTERLHVEMIVVQRHYAPNGSVSYMRSPMRAWGEEEDQSLVHLLLHRCQRQVVHIIAKR